MIVKKAYPDENLIQSLLISSKNKHYSAHLLTLNTTTASAMISLFYDALRELLEAIALKNGFKILNHECYASFLKKYYLYAEEFNELRQVRNDLNYRGKTVTLAEAQELLNRLEKLITYFRKTFDE